MSPAAESAGTGAGTDERADERADRDAGPRPSHLPSGSPPLPAEVQRGAQCVTHPAGVLDGEPALLARDAYPDRAPLAFQLGQVRRSRAALQRLGRREVA